MLRTIAIVFGVFMIGVGVLGFYPPAIKDLTLFGWFAINPFLNFFHILTGVVAIGCGFKTREVCQVYFQVFGIIYALIAIAGFFHGDHAILGLMANNLSSSIFHLIIAAGAIYLGFFFQRSIPRSGRL